MADTVTPERRSEIMSNIRSKGMKPEMAVRQGLHAMGDRYRRKDLPGKPDLVFSRRQAVIFVHGYFWHRHADPTCKIARLPRSNREYWLPKLEGDVARDAMRQAELRRFGWKVLVIWECEIRASSGFLESAKKFLDGDQCSIK